MRDRRGGRAWRAGCGSLSFDRRQSLDRRPTPDARAGVQDAGGLVRVARESETAAEDARGALRIAEEAYGGEKDRAFKAEQVLRTKRG